MISASGKGRTRRRARQRFCLCPFALAQTIKCFNLHAHECRRRPRQPQRQRCRRRAYCPSRPASSLQPHARLPRQPYNHSITGLLKHSFTVMSSLQRPWLRLHSQCCTRPLHPPQMHSMLIAANGTSSASRSNQLCTHPHQTVLPYRRRCESYYSCRPSRLLPCRTHGRLRSSHHPPSRASLPPHFFRTKF